MISDDDAREYCETLLRHFAADLSEWEDGFVRDVQGRLVAGRVLAPGARSKLDEIMDAMSRRRR